MAFSRRSVAILTCATLRPLHVAAFDIDAHDAIGQTSASAMDQTAVKNVKRLLNGQDASDVAGWGHQVDETFPGMNRLHFQTYDDTAKPFCAPFDERVAKCDDNICLVSAIKHFYGKVLKTEGRAKASSFPDIDYNKVAKGVKFSDADTVKMLINLLGDLHQPLHLGHAGDDMGRKVMVKFRGKEVSLYDFWDKTISETVRQEESGFWLGGWTHVRAVQAEFAQDKGLWQSEGADKMFARWEKETAEFACNTAYVHPSTGKKLAGPDAVAGPVEISESDYQTWKRAWLKQVLVAGERTAIVLNDILDASSASKLHEGTGVKTNADKKADEEKKEWAKEREEIQKNEKKGGTRMAPMAAEWNSGNLFKNILVAAVTVPGFLLVINFGPQPAAWAGLVKGLLEPAPAPAGGGNRGPSDGSQGSEPPQRGKRSN